VGKLVDEMGNRYGRWTVIARAENDKGGLACWLCRCECGAERAVRGASLRRGRSKSCGCLHRELVGERYRLPEGEAAFNSLFYHIKCAAKKRGYEWGLIKEEVRTLTRQPCYYCGAEPSQGWSGKRVNGAYIYNGIDRVDNNRGYLPDNVVPCCKRCNFAKGMGSIAEFKDWLRRAYEHINEY